MSGNLRIGSRRIRRRAVCALAVLLCAPVARGEIIGDVVRVGYLVTSGAAVRTGSWTPVVVDLTLQNQVAFDGILRLRQFDRDGDIYVDSVPVHLSDAGAGAQQRYWLYTVANPRRDRAQDYAVELLATEDGDEANARLVQVISGGLAVPAMIPPLQPEPLADDTYLILEISDGAMGRIRHLLAPEYVDRFDRPLAIAHGSPNDLPANWVGLEMVDSVVWENADPTQLTPAQLHALIQWMEQGGRLLLAAGRTSDAVAQSEMLGPLLPVQVGRVRTASELPTVRNKLLGIGADADRGYRQPIVYAECTPVADSTVTRVLYDEQAETTFVASRRVGRGRLIYVAAALGDVLADEQADVPVFFERVLELRRTPIMDATLTVTPTNLFYHLDREVGFYQTGGALLAVAILFAVSYVLVATLGAWKVLQRRNLLKQSWTALALTAMVVSVISLLGVQTLHGVGRKVQQLTIVDGVANQVGAHATAYFGLRTATHSRVDVWLPADYRMDTEPAASACSLKPMLAQESPENSAAFTDPGRYWLVPSTAEIHDAPIRATLKQFEGRWRGDLRGTLLSSVSTTMLQVPEGQASEASAEVYGVAPGSWIENTLDVALHDCLLFLAEGDVMTPQNFQANAQRSDANRPLLRVFQLDTIAAGERIDLHQRLNLDGGGKPRSKDHYAAQGLRSVAQRWGQKFISVGDIMQYGDEPIPQYRFDHYQSALLLLTILSDIDPNMYQPSPIDGLRCFSRARARQLDVADLVQKHSALLVGFTDDAGPVRLCARTSGRTAYEPLEPGSKAAHTMYRFVIPIENSKER